MKKIIGLSMLTLLLSVTTAYSETDCDPDTRETIRMEGVLEFVTRWRYSCMLMM